MSVLEFHRLFLNYLIQDKRTTARRKIFGDNYTSVRKFADMLCHNMGRISIHAWDGKPKVIRNIKKSSIQSYLKRIEDKSERLNRKPTPGRLRLRKNVKFLHKELLYLQKISP